MFRWWTTLPTSLLWLAVRQCSAMHSARTASSLICMLATKILLSAAAPRPVRSLLIPDSQHGFKKADIGFAWPGASICCCVSAVKSGRGGGHARGPVLPGPGILDGAGRYLLVLVESQVPPSYLGTTARILASWKSTCLVGDWVRTTDGESAC
ncbi:hypothetical protein DFH27DRAFT_314175 [Peziza echinospora]|nr:hypothetical protein DFH27DRAFT_314175 [Peziza echinospora]